jgi:hypothetical protein
MNDLRYIESITDFFKSPKWLLNLLFGGICILIPIVGPIVLMGWHATVFYGRSRREAGEIDYWRLPPAQWPEFDFGRFVVYLQRGLWPFLAALVASFALMPVMFVCFLPMFLSSAFAHDRETGEEIAVVAIVISGLLAIGVALLANFVLAPFMLRAYALQDFKATFSFPWVRDFLSRMWKELLLVFLFSFAVGIVFGIGGYVLLCVGIYFTAGIVMFSAGHLQRQLIDLYVQRGGEPLTRVPGLLDPSPATTPTPQPPPPLPPASN